VSATADLDLNRFRRVFGLLAMLIWCGQAGYSADAIIAPSHGVTSVASRQLGRLRVSASVELAHHTGPGYLPVRMTVSRPAVAAADQQFSFRIETRLGEEFPPQTGLVVNIPLTLPQGQRRVTATRYIPKWSLGQSVDVSMFSDGELLDDSVMAIRTDRRLLPVQRARFNYGNAVSWDLAAAGMDRQQQQDWLLVTPVGRGSTAESVTLAGPLQQFDSRVFPEASQSATALRELKRTVETTDADDLPSDWRGYQLYDVVVIDSAVVKQLQADAASIEGLRQWVLMGGTLVVYNSPGLAAGLADLNFGAGVFTRQGEPERRQGVAGIAENVAQMLQLLSDRLETFDPTVTGNSTITSRDVSVELLAADQSLVQDFARWSEQMRAEATDVVDAVHVAAGQLIAINTATHSQSDEFGAAPWVWELVTGLSAQRYSPMVRRGVDPLAGDPRFRQWTVPGVLQPPVYTFMGLLTVFVVLVGPVAYRQTSKHNRTHLMFVIAPAIALVTTLAMFAYGIIADGFGTQARIRQLTWIDGRSGDAGERILSTYFAGIRPASGLQFAGNAEVMRRAEADGIDWFQRHELPPAYLGTVTVRSDGQIFSSDLLPSRDQRQFVVHAPRTNVGSLELGVQEASGQPPSLISTLSVPLRNIVVRDTDQQYWQVESIAAGGKRRCRPLTTAAASAQLSELYNAHRPLTETSITKSNRRRRRMNFEPLKAIGNRNSLSPFYREGLFEFWLQQHLQLNGELPAGHFVALSSVSEDAVAVEDAELVDSVRYVFGTLK